MRLRGLIVAAAGKWAWGTVLGIVILILRSYSALHFIKMSGNLSRGKVKIGQPAIPGPAYEVKRGCIG